MSILAGHATWQSELSRFSSDPKSWAWILQQGARDVLIMYALFNIPYLLKIRKNLGLPEASCRTFLTTMATTLPFLAHIKNENAARSIPIAYAAAVGVSTQFDNALKILPKHLNFFVQYFPQANFTTIPLQRPDVLGDARRIFLTWVSMFMFVSMFWGCLPERWHGHFETIEPFLKGPAEAWQGANEFAASINGGIIEHDHEVHTLAFQIWNTILFFGLMAWSTICCMNSGQRMMTYNNLVILSSAVFLGNHPPNWALEVMRGVNYVTGIMAVFLSIMFDILLVLGKIGGSSR
jgi:hypothetical protein